MKRLFAIMDRYREAGIRRKKGMGKEANPIPQGKYVPADPVREFYFYGGHDVQEKWSFNEIRKDRSFRRIWKSTARRSSRRRRTR